MYVGGLGIDVEEVAYRWYLEYLGAIGLLTNNGVF